MLLLLVLRWPQNHGTNVHHNSRSSLRMVEFMHGNTCLSLEQLGPSAKCLFKSDFYKLLKEWCVFLPEKSFLAFKSKVKEFLRKSLFMVNSLREGWKQLIQFRILGCKYCGCWVQTLLKWKILGCMVMHLIKRHLVE